MYIEKLSIVNFKNIAQVDLEFCSKINCFIGNNGMGKTNILDAIYYLSFCKSYFNSLDSQNINHSKEFFVIQGEYLMNEKQETFYCGVKKGNKKQFKRNKTVYERLADHISTLPLVMISPADISLIHESGEDRRKYMNGVIAQYDAAYLNALMDYNKVLVQRNVLIKQYGKGSPIDYSLLEIWDEKLHELGQFIHATRKKFIEQLTPLFQKYHQLITQNVEQVSLEYQSALHEEPFIQILTKNQGKDLQVGYTSQGIHRDDLNMKLGGYSLKKEGSQGQNKSYLIALKLAQFDLLSSIHHFSPILLLDDIFDKLDSKRVEQIVRIVSNDNFGQIFITDTNRDHLDDILHKIEQKHKLFLVEDGQVKTLDS